MTDTELPTPLVEALVIIDQALYELRSTNLIETNKMMDFLLDIRILIQEESALDSPVEAGV